jgi:hypothetical protein
MLRRRIIIPSALAVVAIGVVSAVPVATAA